ECCKRLVRSKGAGLIDDVDRRHDCHPSKPVSLCSRIIFTAESRNDNTDPRAHARAVRAAHSGFYKLHPSTLAVSPIRAAPLPEYGDSRRCPLIGPAAAGPSPITRCTGNPANPHPPCRSPIAPRPPTELQQIGRTSCRTVLLGNDIVLVDDCAHSIDEVVRVSLTGKVTQVVLAHTGALRVERIVTKHFLDDRGKLVSPCPVPDVGGSGEWIGLDELGFGHIVEGLDRDEWLLAEQVVPWYRRYVRHQRIGEVHAVDEIDLLLSTLTE